MKQRNLMLGERIMYVNGRTPVNCVFTARLRGHLCFENLRFALDRIQSKHPMLQTSILEDRRSRPYFAANVKTPRIPIIQVERTSDDDWLQQSETQWKEHFDLKQGPLARLIWIRGLSVSDLMFVTPHCITDGMTCITLLRELLALLDRPNQDLPPYKPFTDVREMLPSSTIRPNNLPFKTALRSFIARTIFSLSPVPRFTPTGKDYAIHWKLNSKASAILEERCKKEGVSVYAALCVAFLDSFAHIRKERGHNKLICPVNIRKMVPAIKEDMMFAFAPIIELSVNNTDKMSFWDKARQIKKDIVQKVNALNAYDILLSGERFQSCAKKLVQHLLANEGNHDFTFSNLGRLNLPSSYRSFELETVYSITVAFPWRNPNTLMVSSFNGQMDFTFVSNTHTLSREDAIEFKGKAIASLIKELEMIKAL